MVWRSVLSEITNQIQSSPTSAATMGAAKFPIKYAVIRRTSDYDLHSSLIDFAFVPVCFGLCCLLVCAFAFYSCHFMQVLLSSQASYMRLCLQSFVPEITIKCEQENCESEEFLTHYDRVSYKGHKMPFLVSFSVYTLQKAATVWVGGGYERWNASNHHLNNDDTLSAMWNQDKRPLTNAGHMRREQKKKAWTSADNVRFLCLQQGGSMTNILYLSWHWLTFSKRTSWEIIRCLPKLIWSCDSLVGSYKFLSVSDLSNHGDSIKFNTSRGDERLWKPSHNRFPPGEVMHLALASQTATGKGIFFL